MYQRAKGINQGRICIC